MQEQTYGIAGLATLEAEQPPDWQAEAVGDYEQSCRSGTPSCVRTSPQGFWR